MREFRTYGSVRGVPSNGHPYRDNRSRRAFRLPGASRPGGEGRAFPPVIRSALSLFMRTDVLGASAMNQANFVRDTPHRLFRRMLGLADDRTAENVIVRIGCAHLRHRTSCRGRSR
jgi:hypothetical protein